LTTALPTIIGRVPDLMTTNACRDRRPEFEVLVSDDGESNAGLVEDGSASGQHDFEIAIAQSSIDPLPGAKGVVSVVPLTLPRQSQCFVGPGAIHFS
jgi:hypothetical protein